MVVINRNIKKIIKELLILLGSMFVGAVVIFPFLQGYMNLLTERSSLPLLLELLLVPIGTFLIVFVETYGLLLIFPYIIFTIMRYFFTNRLVKRKYLFLLAIILSVPIYMVLVPRLLSCQIQYEDGYYTTKYQACFGWQSGIYDGGTYSSKRLKKIDVKTFISFFENKYYAKDKNHVYYAFNNGCMYDCITQYFDVEKGIKDADPKTFEILTDGYARDKNNCYRFGENIGCEFLTSSTTMP